MDQSNGHTEELQSIDDKDIKLEDDALIERESGTDGAEQQTVIKDENSTSDDINVSTAIKSDVTESHLDVKAETPNAAIKSESKVTNGHGYTSRTKKVVQKSKKPPSRVAPLFDDYPDATAEANSEYQVIDACIYQNKYLGLTEHAMECDCVEEWGESDNSTIIHDLRC